MQAGGGYGTIAILIILIGAVLVLAFVGVIFYFVLRRKKNAPAQIPSNIMDSIPRPPEQYVKRCPKCGSTFTDETLNFCLADGTPLETFNDSEYETTVRKL